MLEEPYRSRAIPTGSARYLSWLFAPPAVRASLLGVYALNAEWLALTTPESEAEVARVKLAWWHDEMGRLLEGNAVHPITRYLSRLPAASASAFAPLTRCLQAILRQVAGAPLERSHDLSDHAHGVYGEPLLAASMLSGMAAPADDVREAVTAYAAAQYLSQALLARRAEARAGRVSLPVEELLAAGVDDADLGALPAPPHLVRYLDHKRREAARGFEQATRLVPATARNEWRHVLVLGVLGRRQLERTVDMAEARPRPSDLYWAWKAARGRGPTPTPE